MEPIREATEARRRARQLHTAGEVAARIESMAGDIEARLAGVNPVILAIMTGGMFLTTQLCRHFDFPYELDYLHVSRYRAALEGGAFEWVARPRTNLEGRAVLLVDDVLDRGVTLGEIVAELGARPLASLHVAVLVSKDISADVARPAVDFVGFTCPDLYLFGCGMDYKGFWRGLPALYGVDGS